MSNWYCCICCRLPRTYLCFVIFLLFSLYFKTFCVLSVLFHLPKFGQNDHYWVIPYEIGTSFHPTLSDFAINGVYCRVLIVRELCHVLLSYLKPYPRKSVRRLTSADRRGRAEIATSKTIDSSALTIELKRVKLKQVILSGH